MTGRVATPSTIDVTISAWQLAKLMALEIHYTAEALAAMTTEERALIERNSKEENAA